MRLCAYARPCCAAMTPRLVWACACASQISLNRGIRPRHALAGLAGQVWNDVAVVPIATFFFGPPTYFAPIPRSP